jgi:hypothetical protein
MAAPGTGRVTLCQSQSLALPVSGSLASVGFIA